MTLQLSNDHIREETLFEYLDSELTSAERQRVEAHLADCDACQEQLAEVRSLFVEIEAMPDLAFDRDLSSAVLAELDANAAASAEEAKDGLWWLAMIGQLLIALGAGLLARPLVERYANSISQQIGSIQLRENFTSWQQMWQQLWPQQLTIDLQQIQSWAGFAEQPLLPSYPLMWWGAAVGIATLFWLAGNGVLLTTLDPHSGIQE